MDWFLYDNGLRHERVRRQPHIMVKHTQTIRQQIADEFDHYVGLALKRLLSEKMLSQIHI